MKNNNVSELNLALFRQAMNDTRPTVVKFYNPTCHLCAGLAPIYDSLSTKYKDFNFAKFNIMQDSTARSISKVFKIEGVPEIYVIMKNYVKNIPYPEEDRVSQTSGYPKDYLIEHLDSILNDINGR